MERIANETEEDYQKLIKLLESFNVEVVRPEINLDFPTYLIAGKYSPPRMMTPRDYTAMIGETFYMPTEVDFNQEKWSQIRGSDWPLTAPESMKEFNLLPPAVLDELNKFDMYPDLYRTSNFNNCWRPLEELIQRQDNKIIYNQYINSAMTSRIGRDLYFGTDSYDQDQSALKLKTQNLFPDYRAHIINTGGHSDGTFCPVKPGLIVSLYDVPSYAETFPDWEVVYLPGQSWEAVRPFLDLKEKNRGKWWVPGEELNDDFTEFVESWLGHWVGYVEETVFDVNMLVIDEKNVVCNNYNEEVFKAFDRHGITPHIVNFRHRYFWDGGLHCITSDLHREGVQKDYFPERG